jgi:hypothetical protein
LRCVSERAPCVRAMCGAGQHAGELVHAQGRRSDHMCPAAGEGEYLQVVEVLPLCFSWSSPPHYQSLSGLGRRKEGPPSHTEIADDQASSPGPSLTGDARWSLTLEKSCLCLSTLLCSCCPICYLVITMSERLGWKSLIVRPEKKIKV